MMTKSRDALDLWADEDFVLRGLFAERQRTRGASVEDRALYGDVAKETIHHLALREAALGEVNRKISHEPQLSGLAVHLKSDEVTRRSLLDRVERMSRGVHSINLNTGQEFDQPLQELIGLVGTDIEWDLDVALPAVSAWLDGPGHHEHLRSAQRVAKHAPTSLNPTGSRWHEHDPVVSRLHTIYDNMRDFPRPVRPQ